MKRQQGVSLVGFILLLGLFGMGAALAVKIGPIYLDSYKIDTAMKKAINKHVNIADTKRSLLRTFDIEDIDFLKEKDLKVTQRNGKTKIRIAYSIRRHIAGNLDIIVSFDKMEQTKR